MTKYEIGTDIQRVRDFKNAEIDFLKKAFSNGEISYCLKKSKPEQHFAARFAAKEAVIKALSQFKKKVFYKDMEILINQEVPSVKIRKGLANECSVKISISHSGDYALAFAVVENGKTKNR